jgi:hypothetical protein
MVFATVLEETSEKFSVLTYLHVLKPLWDRWGASEILEREIQNTKFVILNIHEYTGVLHHLKS